MKIKDLEIYSISLGLSKEAWVIYEALPKSQKYHIGDQLLRSTDSVGANIAEGFGRFHKLDSIRFYYNARGSLYESKHWVQLLKDRSIIDRTKYEYLIKEMTNWG